MSARIDLQAKVDDYIAERHRLGFELRTMSQALASFARYAASSNHHGPLTVDLMADCLWVSVRCNGYSSNCEPNWAGSIAGATGDRASTTCATPSSCAG